MLRPPPPVSRALSAALPSPPLAAAVGGAAVGAPLAAHARRREARGGSGRAAPRVAGRRWW